MNFDDLNEDKFQDSNCPEIPVYLSKLAVDPKIFTAVYQKDGHSGRMNRCDARRNEC